MQPLKRIDKDTPIGTRVVVIVGGSELSIGTYGGYRCGWVHIGHGFNQTLHLMMDVFVLPEGES